MKTLPITAEAEAGVVKHGGHEHYPYKGQRRHSEEKKLAKSMKKRKSPGETLYPVAKSALEESGGYEK